MPCLNALTPFLALACRNPTQQSIHAVDIAWKPHCWLRYVCLLHWQTSLLCDVLACLLARCIHSGALVCDVLVFPIHSAALACDVVISCSGSLQARAVKNQEFNSVPPCESRGFLPYLGARRSLTFA